MSQKTQRTITRKT